MACVSLQSLQGLAVLPSHTLFVEFRKQHDFCMYEGSLV